MSAPTQAPPSVPDTEYADPDAIDHDTRAQTRLAPPTFDTDHIPTPLLECGCGSCSEAHDALASESEVFRDVLDASVCPDPRPRTVADAREVYLRYQRAADNDAGKTSVVERTENQHGQLLGAERELLREYESPTLVFLSLRLSPIETTDRGREWVHPTRLVERLADGWQNVTSALRYPLEDFEWEYVRVTATTTSAATPHSHVLIYVDDPEDEVGIGVAQTAVNSHVRATKGATADVHGVRGGVSDAGMVFHDPPRRSDLPESYGPIAETRDDWFFPKTTTPLLYAADQRPHYVLRRFYDEDIPPTSPLVDGGVISWASGYHKWLSSSDGFPM